MRTITPTPERRGDKPPEKCKPCKPTPACIGCGLITPEQADEIRAQAENAERLNLLGLG